MKKILISVGRLDVGGVELRTLETIRLIKSKKLLFDIYVYVVSGVKGELDKEYENAGVTIIYASQKRNTLYSYWMALKSVQPDVVHINASYASGIFAFVAWGLGVKVRLSHIRSMSFPEMPGIKKTKYFLYIPILNIFSTKVLGVNSKARRKALTPLSKWMTLYDGIESHNKKRINVDDNVLKIVIIGRFHECKNIPFAVKVISELSKEKRVLLTIVGKEQVDIKDEILNVAAHLEVADKIQLLGERCREDVLSILSGSDLLLLTSTREGLPGTILEASSVGVPVVSSDLPGVREIHSYIASVSFLSLDEPLSVWANNINKQVMKWGTKSEEIIKQFDGSPFTVERHVELLEELWKGK